MAYHGPNPGRTRRTFTREQLDASRAAWDAGEFGPEWREWRHLAAMQAGIIDAPQGTRWDSWTDDEPSERAIIVRAIRETPTALRRALTSGRCHTWAQVVREMVMLRDRFGEDADRREHEWDAVRRSPMVPLADTLGVLRDSLGLDR
jgi:hypothetical protein